MTSQRAPLAILSGIGMVALLAGCALLPGGDGTADPAPSGSSSAGLSGAASPSASASPAPAPGTGAAGEVAQPYPATADGTIVTLTPEQVVPLESYTASTPYGSFQLGAGLPAGYPAGVPAYINTWVKSSMIGFVNGDDRQSYTLMFVGSYADIDALLAEFEAQGFVLVSDERDDTKRAIILESSAYRVVITATESAESSGEPMDPSYSYTIVVK